MKRPTKSLTWWINRRFKLAKERQEGNSFRFSTAEELLLWLFAKFDDPHYQRCSKCREVLPLEAFYQLRNGQHSRYCKECMKEYLRVNYERHQQRRREREARLRNQRTCDNGGTHTDV